jgi:hypothetical protein
VQDARCGRPYPLVRIVAFSGAGRRAQWHGEARIWCSCSLHRQPLQFILPDESFLAPSQVKPDEKRILCHGIDRHNLVENSSLQQ